MFLTIFTPAYNRKDKLGRLYQSLSNQTAKNFEWILIDDGSSDGTMEYIRQIAADESSFPVIFKRQNNQGKHAAINHALQLATGEAFFIVDSDDYLPKNAVEIITHRWDTLSCGNSLIGISCLKAKADGGLIGKSYKRSGYLDATNLQRRKYGMKGDRAEVYCTSVLQENPFPIFPGETFLSEAVIWNKLAFQGRKLRFFNDVICICEYLAEGLSHQVDHLFVKNWQGYCYYVNQEYVYRQSRARKLSVLYAACYLAQEKKSLSVKELRKHLPDVPMVWLKFVSHTMWLYKKLLHK